MNKTVITTVCALLAMTLPHAPAHAAGGAPDMSKEATVTPHNPKAFRPDPNYEQTPYDIEAQLKIYGDKQAFTTPRPLIELGGKMYSTGLLSKSSYIFGSRNPVDQQFIVSGDLRASTAYFQDGVNNNVELLSRLNLDMDWKITATERLHALVRPLETDGRLTRVEFNKNAEGDRESKTFDETNTEFDALFFEGDLGAITAGFAGRPSSHDVPFAFGLMPLLFQNGVWLDDAFTGLAFSFPAMHSRSLDISNMDFTFFAGLDKVSTGLQVAEESDINVFGVAAFVEANRGYWEFGYGFTQDNSELGDQSYHNLTAAFTKRSGSWLSHSIRVIGDFGQTRDNNALPTADGFLVLLENSLITRNPSTFIPYFNLFYGADQPQALARAAGAGGVLKNTGLLFESGGLGAIPSMEASGHDTAGGAFGLEYLFSFNQQLVFEVAALADLGDDDNLAAGDQLGFGVRYQIPLSKAWIMRLDGNVVQTSTDVEDKSLAGASLELRRKF